MGEYVIRDDYSYSVPSTRTPPFHVGRQLWFYAKTFKTHPAPLEVIPEHEYRFPRDELESEYERTRDMYTDMTMALVGMLSDCRRGHYIFKFDLSFEWMRRLTFFHPNVNRHHSVLWGGFLDSPFQFLSNWKCFQDLGELSEQQVKHPKIKLRNPPCISLRAIYSTAKIPKLLL